MDTIENLMYVFKDSTDKMLIADNDMHIIWRNDDSLPDKLDLDMIRIPYDKKLVLPLTECIECFYDREGLGNPWALTIQPIKEPGDVYIGYIIRIMNIQDVERASALSGHVDYFYNYLGNIYHYLSEMVMPFNNYIFMHKEGITQEAFDKLVITMKNNATKLLGSTVNINELAHYCSAYRGLRVLNISEIVNFICSNIEPILKKNGIDFDYKVQKKILMETDVVRFRIAFVNLIANALMYNSKDKKICRVELKCNDEIKLTVSDNGDGLSFEDFTKFTRPFGRFDRHEKKEEIGLSVVDMFCKCYEGKLELANPPSSSKISTELTMTFPKISKEKAENFDFSPTYPFFNIYDNYNCVLAKAIDLF